MKKAILKMRLVMEMVLLIMKSLINRQICLKKKTSDKLIKKHFMAQDLKLSLKN